MANNRKQVDITDLGLIVVTFNATQILDLPTVETIP